MNTINPARDPEVIQAVLKSYLPLLHQEYGPHDLGAYADEASARYLTLMRKHRPCLSEAEWLLLVDAFWGTMTLFESTQMAITNELLLLEVEDACTLEGLATKWSVDQAELLRKVAGFSPLETMAVLHVIEYAKGHSGELPIEQALAECGAAV
jgi:hypothetical protein